MNIGLKTFLKYSGKKLPYDAEIEYLESTGTQWIDTGYIPNNTSGFLLRANCTTAGSNNVMFGHRQTSGGNDRWWINFSRTLEFGWNSYQATTVYPQTGTWYEIKLNYLNSRRGYINNTANFNISTTLTTHTGTAKIFIGGVGNTVSIPFSGKISSVIITEGSDIVRDFIPVRKGNKGYMYDRVSGKLFGNQGTGDFVLGPDIVPVEYLESTGTQYINTGFSITPNMLSSGLTTELVVAFNNKNSNQAMLKNGQPYYFIGVQSNKYFYAGLGDNYGPCNVLNDGATHKLSLNSATKQFLIDDVAVKTFSNINGNTASNLQLFECRSSASYLCVAKLFSCKVYQNNILVRDFIPVRVGSGSTWAGAMFDTLTRKVSRNAGTGNFLYGNDKKLTN